jgi:hypothetical protein
VLFTLHEKSSHLYFGQYSHIKGGSSRIHHGIWLPDDAGTRPGCRHWKPEGQLAGGGAPSMLVSGVEELPVPFGDDLNGVVDYFDGGLIV